MRCRHSAQAGRAFCEDWRAWNSRSRIAFDSPTRARSDAFMQTSVMDSGTRFKVFFASLLTSGVSLIFTGCGLLVH